MDRTADLDISGFPGEDCFVNDMACNIQDNNTLAIVPNIGSLPECRMLCRDTIGCSFITKYGGESFPIPNSCVLYSSCPDIHACTDCTSEAAKCWQQPCSGPMQGQVSENLLSYQPGVEEEQECFDACKADSRCAYYTHHNLKDPDFPGVCFLLSSLQAELRKPPTFLRHKRKLLLLIFFFFFF